jgi:hypothetical protein
MVDGHAQYSCPRYGIRDAFAVEERLRATAPVIRVPRHVAMTWAQRLVATAAARFPRAAAFVKASLSTSRVMR